MPLSRQSKIKEVWQHPVGHDILQSLMRQSGRQGRWPKSPLMANLSVLTLDRFAWPGFADMLIGMCQVEPEPCSAPGDEQASWWRQATIYQIYLPSFMDSDHDGVGDLRGVLQRLPYLERLGVDVLWLRPLLSATREGAVRDYRAVGEQYGEEEDLDDLLAAAHERGMRVVLGLDIAATSDEHPWFQKALAGPKGGPSSPEEDTQDFYVIRSGSPDAPPNNWRRSAPAGKAWKWYPELSAWVLRTSGRRRMDLNWENPAVRREMAEVLRFWLEKGIDGFCLGSANLISKGSFEDGNDSAGGLFGGGLPGTVGYEKYGYGPRLHRYLRALHKEAFQGKDAFVMGEVRGLGPEMAKRLTGCATGELDMVLDESHLRVQRRAAPGSKRRPLAKAKGEEDRLWLEDLRNYYLHWMEEYGEERWMSLFFENATTPRLISRVGASPLYRSILAKMMGTWLFTLRGTPILYQGEELGLANTRFSAAEELRDFASLRQYAKLCEGQDPAAALQKVLPATPDHARTPIPWSTGRHAGFTGAEPWIRMPDGVEYLNAAVQLEDPCSVLCHYQRLIALRKQNPCLIYGSFNPVFTNNRKVFCYFRISGSEKWYVEMNLTEKEVTRPGRILRSQKLMLSNYESLSRSLRPYEANLYLCD